jgi:dTDP-4-dehydrorhamnose 3,5-epimerase
MKVIETEISDLLIIQPTIFTDDRGYFFESYNQKKMIEYGLNYQFVQDNQSKSSYGVIRGLHYQLSPHAQTKLVRALQGKILDVAVDIRSNSSTFGQYISIELSEDNKKQLLIPKGFAHGFSVLSESAIVFYKCDEFYHPESERGILYQDASLAIDWKIPYKDQVISKKDQTYPLLNEAEYNF